MNTRTREILALIILFLVTAIAAYWIMEWLSTKNYKDSTTITFESESANKTTMDDPLDALDPIPKQLSLGQIAARQELAEYAFEIGSIADKLFNLISSTKKNYYRELYTFLHAFPPDQTTLSAQLENELSQLALVLIAYPEIFIAIDCHSDNTSDPASMRQLTNAQAESISAFLREKGILNDQFSTTGYGSDMPITPNTNEASRKQNRRIEMSIQAR